MPPQTQSDGYIHIPGIWNGFEASHGKIDGLGYGTYRFFITVPEDGRYGLKLKEVDCAYRLWVNGSSIEVGKVGRTKAEMQPSWSRQDVFFNSVNKQIEVVMQVSNFHHRKGGAEDIILFGTSKQILAISRQKQAITYFLMGVILIMCLHYFSIFLFRRKEKSTLFFSLLCLSILIRLITTGDKVLFDFYPSLSWEVGIRIEYIGYMAVVPLFTEFLRAIYPQWFSKRVMTVLWIIFVTFSGVVLFFPSVIFSYTPILYQWLFVVTTFYNLFKLIGAVVQRMKDSVIMLAGFVLIFLITINDVLYYNKIIGSEFVLPTGLLVLVFSQSFVLSRRAAEAFVNVEVLSAELEDQNLQLEDTVRTRTREVEKQKDEIAKQALWLQQSNQKLHELNAYKEQMVHMIVHDLKNPLNTIIGMSRMKDIQEKDVLVELAGKQMLQLVMNLLDVNKYEHSELKPLKTPVLATQLIEKAIAEVSYVAAQRNLRFITDVTPLVLMIEEDLMLRVLVNILSNAIKFSPANSSIFVSVSLRNADWGIITIRDQGPGIRPEIRKVIFERYVSNAQGTISLVRSTGLGLSYCKLVVEAHGGCVGVSENVAEGTEFYVELPMKADSDAFVATATETISDMASPRVEMTEVVKNIRQKLQGVHIYEVSRIWQIIGEKEQDASVHRHPWIAKLKLAVKNCNEEEYDNLIQITPDESI